MLKVVSFTYPTSILAVEISSLVNKALLCVNKALHCVNIATLTCHMQGNPLIGEEETKFNM